MRPYYRSWEGWLLNTLVAHGAIQGAGVQSDCIGYAAVEDRAGQQTLRQFECNASASNEEAVQQSIMGWGR